MFTDPCQKRIPTKINKETLNKVYILWYTFIESRGITPTYNFLFSSRNLSASSFDFVPSYQTLRIVTMPVITAIIFYSMTILHFLSVFNHNTPKCNIPTFFVNFFGTNKKERNYFTSLKSNTTRTL